MTIKQLRKITGLTQEKFAEYYGIPIRTIQEWEYGRVKPKDYVMKLLIKIWKLEHLS